MGFSLNNLSNSLLKMGTSFLQMGTFYAAAKSMNHGCGSIFGGGCCGGGGYYGIGYTAGPVYGGSAFIGGGYGLGQIAADRYLMGQMYAKGFADNQAISMLNAGSAYMMPGMTGFPSLNMNLPGVTTATTQQALPKTSNPAADKVDADQSTSLAEVYEQNIKDKKETRFVTSDWKDMPEGADKNDAHRAYSNNFGKSYIMHMDKTAGNADGEITLDEFKEYNIKTDLGEKVSEDLKKAANESSEVIFNKLDQNGDGKLDWKEMSSMMTVYDSMKDGKYDGVITNEELEAGNNLMLDKNNQTMDQKLRAAYKDIFDPE